jgi:hypothetical protein
VETVTVAASASSFSWLMSPGGLVVVMILVAAVAAGVQHFRNRNRIN